MLDTMNNYKKSVGLLGALALLGYASTANAELGLNFPPPASQGAQEIYDIHMLTTTIATVRTLAVFAVVLFAVFRFRKSRGYEADQNFHKTWFGRWS